MVTMGCNNLNTVVHTRDDSVQIILRAVNATGVILRVISEAIPEIFTTVIYLYTRRFEFDILTKQRTKHDDDSEYLQPIATRTSGGDITLVVFGN